MSNVLKFNKKVICLTLYLFVSDSFANNIKLYTWWDYVNPEVTKNLRSKNIQFTQTTYTSNNQAISRLFRNKDVFDFAIVSKLTMKALEKHNVFNKKILKNIIKQRIYNKLTNSDTDFCIPYLWGPTVYVYKSNSDKQIDFNPTVLLDYLKKGTHVEVIDDHAEFYSMIKSSDACLEDDISCYKKLYSEFGKYLSSKNFKSDIDVSKIRESYIFYGWLGSAKKILTTFKNVQVSIPKKVVIGQDYLCALSKSKTSVEERVKFALELTTNSNSLLNEGYSGYFSPYIEKEQKTLNLFSKLKKIFEVKILKKQYIYLPNVGDREFHDLENHWPKVRYE